MTIEQIEKQIKLAQKLYEENNPAIIEQVADILSMLIKQKAIKINKENTENG